MYWGKSLDECTNQFCHTSWGLSLPFARVAPQTPETKSIGIQKPRSSLKVNNLEKEKLHEKRSLKKSQNDHKSQNSSSMDISSALFAQTINSTGAQSSKKTLMRKISQKGSLNYAKTVDKLSTNGNTLRNQIPKHHQVCYFNQVDDRQRVWEKQNKTKDHPILKLSCQVTPQENINANRFSHSRNSQQHRMISQNHWYSEGQENIFVRPVYQGFENEKFTECVSPNNRRISQNVKMQNQNVKIFGPYNRNSQTIRYQESNHNFLVPVIQLNCPKNSQSSRASYQTPIQSIQNLVNDQTHRYALNEFPTIREQNSTYEQSKSINENSSFKGYNSVAVNELDRRIQQFPVLNSINNTLQQQNGPQKNEETFYDVIKNQDSEFQPGSDSSKIEGENKVLLFDLSCEELLFDSEKTNELEEQLENLKIYQQLRKNDEEQLKHVQNQRRQMHQPSICLRVIENKLRGSPYQMSQTSSQGVQSHYISSNPLQSGEAFPFFASPRHIKSPKEGTQQQNIKSPNQFKMVKNSVKFNLDTKNLYGGEKENHYEQDSPIRILNSDRSVEIYNLATFGKEKEDREKVSTSSLFKQINMNQIHSERQLHPSIRKLCMNTKRVKSLVQHKMTIDSIFEDSSQLAKNQSDQLISKYMLDDNFEYGDGMLSNQNVEREESTVIDRYTFDSRLTKLI